MDQRIASKNQSQIIAGIRSLGTTEVARLLNCSESTVSELSSESKYKLNFHSFGELLARMGYKIVKADQVCCDPKKLESIMLLAKEAMNNMTADSLEWPE